MNTLFNACNTALFARTTGNLVSRCLSSGVISLSLIRRIDHRASIITAENGLLLTRFRACCYSTRNTTRVGKSKKKNSDSKLEKMLGEEKNAFFVVRKGDLVGVYKNLNDCQAQVGSSVCDPPVSVYKGYTMPKEAEEYMISCGLKNALYSIKAADLTEELFGNLVACPFQQPHFALGEPSDHLSKRRFQEVLGSQTGEAFGLTSMSSDPARKHAKLEHLATQALTNNRTCILEFDGASKGNPGQAGAGAVLRTDDGNLICRLREGLGIATNNVAEYRAIILGLRYALSKGFTSIRVLGDSKLVCMQVQGLWKVKNQNISKLYEEAKKLKDKFLCFQIDHVLRVQLLFSHIPLCFLVEVARQAGRITGQHIWVETYIFSTGHYCWSDSGSRHIVLTWQNKTKTSFTVMGVYKPKVYFYYTFTLQSKFQANNQEIYAGSLFQDLNNCFSKLASI